MCLATARKERFKIRHSLPFYHQTFTVSTIKRILRFHYTKIKRVVNLVETDRDMLIQESEAEYICRDEEAKRRKLKKPKPKPQISNDALKKAIIRAKSNSKTK